MFGDATTARDGDAADGEAILSRALARFGHTSLRPGQAEVISDIFSGRPVVAVMPTGAGKSLCYQLPAVVLGERGGVTLVVSPLIALMKDQVDALRARGVPAVALTSAAGAEEQREIIEGIRAGEYTLVYVAPERFRSPRFVDALRAIAGNIALVAIDEAHCISEWGHDFRPDYLRLGQVVARAQPPRIAAFTATATPEVRTDIATQLGIDDFRASTCAASIARTSTTRSEGRRRRRQDRAARRARAHARGRRRARLRVHAQERRAVLDGVAPSRHALARLSRRSRGRRARPRPRTCSWPASST